MYQFKDFSPESKIWIYQSNRKLNADEVASINRILGDFALSWTAHNHQLKAEAVVYKNHFLLFCVDENIEKASGCSIDKSFHVIRSLEKEFNITLFNRLFIAFEHNNEIEVIHMNDFIERINNSELPTDTIIYNNSITTLNQFNTEWQQPASESWISIHLNSKVTS